MQLFLIIGFLIAIIAVIFAVQNAFSVTVNFFIWEFESSLALVLLLTFILGFIASFLTSSPAAIKRRLTTSNLKKELERLKKELEEKNRTGSQTPSEELQAQRSQPEKLEE